MHYYSFDLEEGERIYLSLFKSSDAKEKDFLPALVLLGPGLKTGGLPPGQLALPREASDLKILTAEGKSAASAVYEPFGPSSFIELAEINISAPESARYYAAVYSNVNSTSNSTNGKNSTPGHYGLAVGYREEFSFSERITTPLRLISVYLWEGQSLGLILIPYLVAEIVALLFFWRGSRRTSFCLAGSLGRISLPGHQRLRLHADGLQPYSRSLWARGEYHGANCRFQCPFGCGSHSSGQRRSRDTAKSPSGRPGNPSPAGWLGTDHGSHYGNSGKLSCPRRAEAFSANPSR